MTFRRSPRPLSPVPLALVLGIASIAVAAPAAAGVTEFSVPTVGGLLTSITRGPDGNVWFTEELVDRIGRITPTGVVTEFALPPGSGPGAITGGPDGNLWFTESGTDRIGRLTPAGALTEFPIPLANPNPSGSPPGRTATSGSPSPASI